MSLLNYFRYVAIRVEHILLAYRSYPSVFATIRITNETHSTNTYCDLTLNFKLMQNNRMCMCSYFENIFDEFIQSTNEYRQKGGRGGEENTIETLGEKQAQALASLRSPCGNWRGGDACIEINKGTTTTTHFCEAICV